jgi:hypothetical protein
MFHAGVRTRIWSMMGKHFECFAKLWFFVSEEFFWWGEGGQIFRMGESEVGVI